MEGSAYLAQEMEAFINANRAAMEAWVSAGGRLFLNAAPSEDNGMLYGFGGVQLIFPAFSNNGYAVNPGHAIFNGPYLPAGTSYSGGSFAHAAVSGATPLITGDSGYISLAERSWGNGWVLFGGMTLTYFHNPQPNATNLLANTLVYLRSVGVGPCPSSTQTFTAMALWTTMI
jgi:hypothetical protein